MVEAISFNYFLLTSGRIFPWLFVNKFPIFGSKIGFSIDMFYGHFGFAMLWLLQLYCITLF